MSQPAAAPTIAPSPGAAAPHLLMEHISKRFGSVQANTDVTFELCPGDVHALLGENGAGKSTLMSILFGLLKPDDGSIRIDGRDVRFGSPADALAAGIGMVHQHFLLVPTLTVAENIVIGSRPSTRLSLRPKRIDTEVAEAAERYGFAIDPRAKVAELSVEDRQRVEILRLLYRGARILILDEPTAALGTAHVDALLDVLTGLKAAGRSIVIVTHKLDEVMRIADRATVLRGGCSVAGFDRPHFDQVSLTAAMFGEVPSPTPTRTAGPRRSATRVAITGLTVRSADGRERVRGLDLHVRAGEIVGVAGVAGNGQSELIDAIAGVRRAERGTIRLDDIDITALNPLGRRRLGVGVIPEDRHRSGLVLDMTVAENLALAMVPAGEASQRGLLSRAKIDDHAREQIEKYGVRPPDPDRAVLQLSGGNQQKIVVARELSRRPSLLVASSPTRGVDLAAAANIHECITEAARSGCAVVITSPDLDEILSLADRVAVILNGRITHEVSRAEASIEALGSAMVGHSVPEGIAG